MAPARGMLVKTSAPFLYKYSSAEFLDRLQSILLKHELYFPNPAQLNDPAEARPKLISASPENLTRFFVNDFLTRKAGESPEFLARGIKEVHTFVPAYGSDLLTSLVAKALHDQLSTHRIYSLTTRPDNEALWKRYSLDHTGYCLEFENAGFPFVLAHDVAYGDTVTVDVTDREQVNAFLLFRKTMAWREEEEVRIVLFPRGQPAICAFEPVRLRRVILGRKMTPENKQTIRECCQIRIPQLLVVEETELALVKQAQATNTLDGPAAQCPQGRQPDSVSGGVLGFGVQLGYSADQGLRAKWPA